MIPFSFNSRQGLLALLFLVGLVMAPLAAEENKDRTKEELPDGHEACEAFFKGMSPVTKDLTLSADNLKSFLANYKAFTELCTAEPDFILYGLNAKSWFDHEMTSEAYKKWAATHHLDAEKFLRIFFRTSSGYTKVTYLKEANVDCSEGTANAQAILDDPKQSLTEGDKKIYHDMITRFNRVREHLKRIGDSIPGPTDGEEKLFAANQEALEEAYPAIKGF